MDGLGGIITSIFTLIGDVLSPSITTGSGAGSETSSVAYASLLAVPAALGILGLAKFALKKSGGKK